MAEKILMPALSPTMKKGRIGKWMLSEGDKVEIGQVIAEIETDKAIMEFESTDSGFLGQIIHKEGSEIEVGTQIAWLLNSKDEVVSQSIDSNSKSNETKMENKGTEKKEVSVIRELSIDYGSKNSRFTPAARARALELGISIESIQLDRQIRERDVVEIFRSQNQNIQDVKSEISNDEPSNFRSLTSMQKVISRRMTNSKQQVPHFYIETEVKVDELMKVKAALESKVKTTLTHWMILAASEAIKQTPIMMNSWHNGQIKKANSIDISIAVDIPNGLVTPVIKNVDKMRITELTKEVNFLIEKSRNRSLQTSEYEGGVLTISNMGTWGITRLFPIINQPQSAILGIGCSRDKLTLLDGQLKSHRVISVTLSGDHRILNGADGASFLRSFKTAIENPLTLLS